VVDCVGSYPRSSLCVLASFPAVEGGTPYADTDRDGMPDVWETAQCLDPVVADDSGDAGGDVYTNVEEFLNGTQATPDPDGDGVRGACDNCPALANPFQQDHDGDGIGTGCDGQCVDGFDNDYDGAIDHPADGGCTMPSDPVEGNPGCGLLGLELLPLLAWALARRRGRSAPDTGCGLSTMVPPTSKTTMRRPGVLMASRSVQSAGVQAPSS
jgi:hypothetical protein